MFSTFRPTSDIRRSTVAISKIETKPCECFRLLAQATDRRVAHVVRPSDVRKHLSCLPTCNRFLFLMAGQLGFPTKDYSPRLRTFPPLASPRPDPVALELSETAQNGQHQATMCCRSVSPSISQGFEPSPFSGDRPQQIKEIASGPRQSI